MHLAQTLQTKRYSPGTLLSRVALVQALSALNNQSLDRVAKERYGDDEEVLAVLRAATGTADTTTAGWAAELVGTDVQALVAALAPASAYAALATRALRVEFAEAGSVRVPFDAGAGDELAGAWVGENGVIPVKRGIVGAATLGRFKMGVISILTEEITRASTPNAEAFVSRMIYKHTARALDAHFLSANPGKAGFVPRGIVNGVAPIAASAVGNTIEKAIADLSALVAGIIAAGNGDRIVLALNTVQRLALAAMRDGNQWVFRDELARGELMGVEMVSSRNVPLGNVYAVDCDNLITGLGAAEVDASREVTLVAADAGPAAPTNATAIGDRTAIGTPDEVPPDGGISLFDAAQRAAGKAGEGAQSVSMFQQMGVALRTVLPISWATTRAGSAQWVSGVAW